MERNAGISGETIGREEFESVWDRVTAPDAPSVVVQADPPAAISVVQEIVKPQTVAPVTVAKPAAKQQTAAAAKSNTALAPLDRAAEAARLCEIMGRCALTARECCAIAKRCKGRVREVCKCIERSARATIRDLGTQYYILTGECCCPGSVYSPTCDTREALRRICANEAETRELCLEAAGDTQFPSLETAYVRAARNAACRERAAENLLGKMGCNA
ncbi:MAG: hypothetical protein LBN00_05580 [Oscillospiraceae bacterium]|jgi:hypothetical protein|nr:hypothetical protein [Oscillospiraceae bacterium]